MYEFMWFVIGIVVYRTLSFFTGYSILSPFVKEVYLLGLIFLSATVEDLVMIKKLKYKLLRSLGDIEEEELKLLRIVDEQMIENWKHASINRFASVWPRQFRKEVDYKTWNDAMNAISDRYKEEVWK